jgi:hypothetical protein
VSGRPSLARAVLETARAAHAPGAVRTWRRIARAWGLDTDAARRVIGATSVEQLDRWAAGDASDTPLEAVERLGHLMGIWAALARTFGPRSPYADAWITIPNAHPTFGGAPPLALIADGDLDGLRAVRAHLTAPLAASNSDR